MKSIGLMLPPAAAIVVLAFLFSSNALLVFPLQILLGISLLVGASYLYREKVFGKKNVFGALFQHMLR